MEEAAKCWGLSHEVILFKFCSQLVRKMYGDDCHAIFASFEHQPDSVEKIRSLSGLDEEKAQKAISTLINLQIISLEPSFSVSYLPIMQSIMIPHFLDVAEEKYIIPPDKPLISMIICKVIAQPGLSPTKIADSIATSNPDTDRSRIILLVSHLCDCNILQSIGDDSIEYNPAAFLSTKRLNAIENIVQYQDQRVLDVVRSLLSSHAFGSCLDDCASIQFEEEDIIQMVSSSTGLSSDIIKGIMGILRSPEVSLISPATNELTPSEAINIFRIRTIASILGDIGYPLARRVINLLIKSRTMETVKMCDMLLLPLESGCELLGKLQALGVIDCEVLEDAPHTNLKRHYKVWKLSIEKATNNASSYLIGVLAKYNWDLENEQQQFTEAVKRSGGSDAQRQKKFEERCAVLQNTIKAVMKLYISVHEL